MNTPYLRFGLVLAVLLSAVAYALQPGPRCGVPAWPAVHYTVGDLATERSTSAADLMKRPHVELPTFPGCDAPNYEERARCGQQQLARYLNNQVNPRIVRGKKGRVIIAYTIDLAGQVREAELARPADPELAAEMMRIVGNMQGQDLRWRPAKIDGVVRAMTILLQVSIGQSCQNGDDQDAALSITTTYAPADT